jgi:hypothetical protein
MKNYIPASLFLYDYGGLIARLGITLAISVVVFSVMFGDVM